MFVSYSGDKKNVVIPKELKTLTSVSKIVGTTAEELSGVTYSVEEGNTLFKVQNGMLMSADGTVVYAAMSGVAVELTLTGVTEIKPYAFAYGAITSVNMPDVKTVGDYAFYGCASLGSIDIGDKVERLGSGAMDGIDVNGTITVRALAVPKTDINDTIGIDFAGIVYVPAEALESYQNNYDEIFAFYTLEAIPKA